jgi:hypothetical protein
MPKTIADILAEVQTLSGLADTATQAASDAQTALQNVADVTAAQNALVLTAQSNATVAINAAQSDADAKVAASDAAKKAENDLIDTIEADLTALK